MAGDANNRQLTLLVELLVNHSTLVLSGERIARQLGVSRSSVWRAIEQLRFYGVEIRGHPATGYQLESAPDLLLESIVAPHLRSGTLGRRIHHYFRLDSTQEAGLAAARAGEPPGAVFIAEEQTAGRGRHGHQWHSPPSSGVYFSLLLRPAGPPAGMLPLTLGAALATAEAVRDLTGREVDIRWPNDVLIRGRKCAGILLEMSAEATRIHHAVLGIGVNVNQTQFPPELEPIATSLRLETGTRLSRVQLLVEVLRHLEDRYQQFAQGGTGDLLRDFEHASSYARGRRVQVGEGAERVRGTTRGLDAFGFLLLEADAGRVATIHHGEVRADDAAEVKSKP